MTISSAEQDAAPQPRVDNRTLREQVLEHLRDDILSSRIRPGTVLGEAALAESFGVSRGPIREAMAELASEGLLTTTPRRGAVVTELSREEFIDAYQVREALETLAIRLAVPRLSEEDIRALRDLHEEMLEHARQNRVADFFATNADFHGLFVSGSGNRKLQETYGRLIHQMGRYLTRSLELRGSLAKSAAEHAAILETVEARDAEKAADLLADHIEVPQPVVESNAGEELFKAHVAGDATAKAGGDN